MYFVAIKNVLDHSIPIYAKSNGLTDKEVDKRIGEHIAKTRNEHRSPDPSIDYEDPLYRLGYLYVHVGANASLFEKVMTCSKHLGRVVESATDSVLTVCAVGGGPGTELLGLARYIAEIVDSPPSRLSFTVLDRVAYWGESWSVLADQCREILKNKFDPAPSVESNFQPMDVTDPQSYENYGWLFGQSDIFVFNYLVSENKVRMDEFKKALASIVSAAKSGALYVFIDRLEADGAFSTATKKLISEVGLSSLKDFTIDGCMADSESDLGDYPQRFNARPRRWFRTMRHRTPTVFAVVAKKQ